MSYLTPRALVDARSRARELGAAVPSLAVTAALFGLAGLLVQRWSEQATAVPVGWQLPSAEALFLVPGAPVVGLLATRALGGGRLRSPADQHLMRMASRWSAGWAAVTALWFGRTVADLQGVPLTGLRPADNLVAVVAASDAAVGQWTVLWVALLVALFGERFSSRPVVTGLLVLTGAALLVGMPASVAAAHSHPGADHPLVLATAAGQLLALAVWVGALVALPHLRVVACPGPASLARTGRLVTAAVVVLGLTGVLDGLLLPVEDGASPIGLALGQVAAVGLVTAVGHRHRRRSGEVLDPGRGPALLAVAGADVVVLTSVVLIGFVLPVAG